MEAAPRNCTCNAHRSNPRFSCARGMSSGASSSSSSSGSRFEHGVEGGFRRETIVVWYLPRLILALLSGALTWLFAIAGAFTGAVTGALAGRASDSGVLRGAGLGAIAGAVLSVEVLEASRSYWCAERAHSRSSPSMADFVEELLHGRLAREELVSTVFTDHRWQVSIGNITYERMYAAHEEIASKGLSVDSLKKLPYHVFTDESKERSGVSTCCTICLQDIEVGETVRSLSQCHHTFHLTCVDKWLVGHGSCPICRQNVR